MVRPTTLARVRDPHLYRDVSVRTRYVVAGCSFSPMDLTLTLVDEWTEDSHIAISPNSGIVHLRLQGGGVL
jgi:hypothetical protein